MMTALEKSAYRGSLLALLAVSVLVLAAGFIGERIHSSRSNWRRPKASLRICSRWRPAFRERRTVAFCDRASCRRGGLLMSEPCRRACRQAGIVRSGEDQRPLGLVRRNPWSTTFPLEAKDSLLWAHLPNMPQAVCEQFAIAAARHPDQVAYISAFGNPAVTPAVLNFKYMCSQNFNNFIVFMVDPAIEVRRLSADVQNAIRNMPADPAQRAAFPGSAAPFQIHGGIKDLVKKSEEGGPAFIQNDRGRHQGHDQQRSICRLQAGDAAGPADIWHGCVRDRGRNGSTVSR